MCDHTTAELPPGRSEVPPGGTKCFGSWKQQPDLPRSCQKPRLRDVPVGKRPQGKYRCCGRLLECCSKQETDRRV